MRKSILLAVLFLAQIANPTIVTGQTNPPQGAGGWTIPSYDETWLNNSQALIQGDIRVYGNLTINGSNVYLWGSNNGDREVHIYSGGVNYRKQFCFSVHTQALVLILKYIREAI